MKGIAKVSLKVLFALSFSCFAPCSIADDGYGYEDWANPVTNQNFVIAVASGFVSHINAMSGGRIFPSCAVDSVVQYSTYQGLEVDENYDPEVDENYDPEVDENDDVRYVDYPATWLVTLSPSGYVFMAGLDCMAPVQFFSETDFDSGSDLVLNVVDELTAKAENLYWDYWGYPNPDWDALMRGSSSQTTATSAASDAGFTWPMLLTKYDQSQPYNDYSPVFDPDPAVPDMDYINAQLLLELPEGEDEYGELANELWDRLWKPYQNAQYRGRAPAGCVAVVDAQLLAHYRWPSLLDADYYGAEQTYGQTNRISGQASVGGNEDAYGFRSAMNSGVDVGWDFIDQWNQIAGGYSFHFDDWIDDSWFDTRGVWGNLPRHAVARLVFACATLSETVYGSYNPEFDSPDNSSASFDEFARKCRRWFEPAEEKTFDETVWDEVVSSLGRGEPVPIRPGSDNFAFSDHIAIIDGCAKSPGGLLVHVNFGWGGRDDGWFDSGVFSGLDEANSSSVYFGFRPRPKPQLDELPQVLSLNQSVSWRFPDFWTNRLDGWIVRVAPFCGTAETRTIDFSSVPAGTLEGPCARFDTAPMLGGDGGVLHVATSNTCYWTAPERAVLSSRSSVSFMLGAKWTKNTVARLQAEYGDNVWTNVATWAFESNAVVKAVKVRAFVGDHAGECALFRICVDENENDRTKYEGGTWEFDDFTVSDAYFIQQPHVCTRPAEARSMPLSNLQLEPGARVEISVEPVFGTVGATATDATVPERSDAVLRFVEGVASVPVPAIESAESVFLPFSTNGILPWSWSGYCMPNDGTIYGNPTNVQVEAIASLPCGFSDSATFRFAVASTNYFRTSLVFDEILVDFIGFDGTSARIFATTNDSGNAVGGLWSYSCDYTVPLPDVSGKPGIVRLAVKHARGAYDGQQYGVFVSGIAVDGALVPSTPDAVSEPITMEALGKPQFLAIAAVHEAPLQDGMYRECGRGTSVLYVKCSPTTEQLLPWTSHPSFVAEEDIAVHPLGGGEFALEIDASRIPQCVDRARVILTLDALDANYSRATTECVLRFSSETEGSESWAVEWTPPQSDSAGTATAAPVEVPCNWLVESGVAVAGSSDSAFTRAAAADGDGDGVPNAVEWICGTDPDSSQSALRADISFPSGANVPDVDWSPKDSVREGYEVVLEGRGELGSGEWERADTTRHHFFRATVRRE